MSGQEFADLQIHLLMERGYSEAEAKAIIHAASPTWAVKAADFGHMLPIELTYVLLTGAIKINQYPSVNFSATPSADIVRKAFRQAGNPLPRGVQKFRPFLRGALIAVKEN